MQVRSGFSHSESHGENYCGSMVMRLRITQVALTGLMCLRRI